MNTSYEIVIVFDSLEEPEVTAQLEKVEATIRNHGGSITKQDIWGRQQLAYPINKKDYGVYVVLVFDGDNSLVAELRRQLRINDAVLRSLIVHKDRYAPDSLGPAEREAAEALQQQQRPQRGDGGHGGHDRDAGM